MARAITPCESLPIELLELVVDEVSTERLTLGSCLSVSRSFRHCSLRHLYRSVEILVEEKLQAQEAGMARIAALRQLISPRSRLHIEGVGRYIKTFALSFQTWHLGICRDASTDTTRLPQLMEDENLLAVIRGLGAEGYGVQQFYLHIIPHRHIKLAELSKEFCAAFQVLTQSPYLKTLQVQNMTLLPHTKRPIYDVHLKYVQPDSDISQCEISSSKQSFGIGTDTYCNQLERLYTDHSFPHENISSQVLRTLKKLVTYDMGPEDSAKTWEIVKMAASSLRTICIFHSKIDKIALPSNSFNLGQIPNLEHFSYVQSHLMPTSRGPSELISTLTMLRSLLEVNQPMRSLKTLDFDIEFGHVVAIPGVLHLLDNKVGDLWRSFDALLAGDNYPLLSQTQFHIWVVDAFPRAGNFIVEALTQSLENNFLCLSSSGRISFKVDVRDSL